MTTTVVNNSVFRFEKQKLFGPNFIDWYRKLRIVLSAKDKLNYLELPIPDALVHVVAMQPVPSETLIAHTAWVKGKKDIVVLMLMTMKPDLQWNLETLGAYVSLEKSNKNVNGLRK
nr:zinc finger, CCHC-type [Tanacetum cinerariifolium]